MNFESAIRKAAEEQPMVPNLAHNTVPGMVAHIDGDFCAYYYGAGDALAPDALRFRLDTAIYRIKSHVGAERAVVHITSPASSKGDRYLIAKRKRYQAQRKTGERPTNWAATRAYFESYSGRDFEVELWADREADDAIAMYARRSPSQTAICTIDKDMRMLPGRHLVWKTWEVFDLDPEVFVTRGPEGKLYGEGFFWLQMLMGDRVDNIPGLPKMLSKGAFKTVGESRAMSYLSSTNNTEAAFDLVAGAYEELYGDNWAIEFCEQAMLLWLRGDVYAGLDDFESILPRGTRLEQIVRARRVIQLEVDAKKKEIAMIQKRQT